jgi:hypothetical protein
MFNHITIVNIDGRPGDHHETQLALSHSAAQMPGARCLMLSPTKPWNLLPPIEHIQILPLGYLDYSLFVTFALHQFIETDFALIVQNDGWVLNGDSFTKEFMEFDYIGAPCHYADVITHGVAERVRRFRWVPQMFRQSPGVRVNFTMNGGFSLRSKRFLQTPSALGLDYRLRPPKLQRSNDGAFKMHWPEGDAWEDGYHCLINRAAMDGAGIRFAPPNVAVKFAFEHLNPILHEGVDISKVFGHHMNVRRLVSLDPLTIRHTHKEHEVRSIMMEPEILEAFVKMGYRLEFAT